MNLNYCNYHCPIGIVAREKFLDENNSAYDAAIDFYFFAKDCFKTCKYKDKHVDTDNKIQTGDN